MSDDLHYQLRDRSQRLWVTEQDLLDNNLFREAADRIKELELDYEEACNESADCYIMQCRAEAKLAKAVEALKSLHHAVCGENGFIVAVRNHSGKAYPWEPIDIADEQTRTVLAELEGG